MLRVQNRIVPGKGGGAALLIGVAAHVQLRDVPCREAPGKSSSDNLKSHVPLVWIACLPAVAASCLGSPSARSLLSSE